MTDISPKIDKFDHAAHLERAFELAREAGARGDGAFGSVLVRDDKIIMSDSNRIVSERDIRRHPELHLAYMACQKFTPEERAEMVMYTSTEPCPMCAGGMRVAGFARVIYSVGADDLTAYTGNQPTARAAQILAGITDVQGPVLKDQGLRVHDEYSR